VKEELRNKYEPHSDLALEEREKYENNVEIEGVVLEKNTTSKGVIITKMTILSEKGAKIMGKPRGTYITIESDPEHFCDNEEVETIVCDQIKKLIKKKDKKILIVGLGNINATPDALGPRTVEKVKIRTNVICIAPGVLAQTGMESFNIIKGIVNEEKPELVIAIDSLAARNARRVATTIQITDTGIVPGSGIGNHRPGLDEANLGVPVVAVGVPMVINSATIVGDTMDQLIEFLSKFDIYKDVAELYEMFNREEKIRLIEEIMDGGSGRMYVTPKDVDEIIVCLSNLLAGAINKLIISN